jgi:hypothetical protein
MRSDLLRHVPKELRDDILKHKEILGDKEILRIPMSIMDAVPRTKLAKLDDGLFPPEHRNGYRVNKSSLTDDAKAKRAALYDSYDKELSTAYLKDDAATENAWREDYPGASEGDICTVRGSGYPNDIGSAGHLELQEGRLVCVPDAPKSATDAKRRKKTQLRDPEGREQGTEESEEDLSDARSARDAAYAAYEKDLTSAWKQPIHDHTPSNNPKRRPAIADYNRELENAWRGK